MVDSTAYRCCWLWQAFRHAGAPLLFLAILLATDLTDVAAKPLPSGEDILILNSYHRGYLWSDNETDGILAAFTKAGLTGDPRIEYLDCKHYPQQEKSTYLRDLLRYKVSSKKPALVMTMDNPAFDFAMAFRQELFADVPIVFLGLNDFEPAMIEGKHKVTGIVERQDIVGTVETALRLHPGTREFVVIHDYTSSGLASRKEAEDQLAPLAGQVAFRYLPEMSMSQIVDVLHSLSPGSLVLAFSFGRDKDGKIFNHDELARVLSSNSPVPVYGTKKERLGFGIIGGRLLDGQSHGAAGAELALQVLAGADPDLLPVIANPQSPLYFDYQVLKRFRIPLGRLPANSILVNRPPGFYSQHKQVIDTAAIIIAILSFSLVTVIINNRSRRRAEAALRESERYRFLFVNASDAILILNAAGQVLDVNAIACDLLGHSRESLMAMTLADLMPPTWLATADAAHGGIQQSGHCVFESVLLRQDGTPLPVEISSRRLVFRGEPAILISFRDITDRQHAEEEIRKLNAELEERVQRRTRELALANEEMEAFCYSVSHDLRGPLRHINGYGTILMEEHSGQLDDGAREYLTRLRRASRHMGQLIDDLLKLSQVSRSEMVLGEVNLSTLAREVMTELQQANPERRVACAITDGIVATGDARLLRVVLDNLLGNAWKYTSHKEVATIEFGTTRENGTTAYFVRDDGAGFDMTYADKLFGPFQRLHRSDEFEGTGIGLATVQRIILRHGGQVWGIGKPGQGATFWFTLGT